MTILSKMPMRERSTDGRRAGKMSAAMVASLLELGLGLIDVHDGTRFWGLTYPRDIVRAYRGMQILDRVTEIREDTICQCYHAGGRELDDTACRYIDRIHQETFPEIYEVRQEILAQPIPQDKFDEILMICLKEDIPISAWALEEALDAGDIMRSNAVEKVFQRDVDDAKRSWHKR